MPLESDILADFRALLAEHGVQVRWKTLDFTALASRVRADQQIDLGGFVASPDLTLRVAKDDFPGPPPKFGERIEVDGAEYRIAKVGNHPRSPLLTLSLTSTDE
jgi:hypothetical protein